MTIPEEIVFYLMKQFIFEPAYIICAILAIAARWLFLGKNTWKYLSKNVSVGLIFIGIMPGIQSYFGLSDQEAQVVCIFLILTGINIIGAMFKLGNQIEKDPMNFVKTLKK